MFLCVCQYYLLYLWHNDPTLTTDPVKNSSVWAAMTRGSIFSRNKLWWITILSVAFIFCYYEINGTCVNHLYGTLQYMTPNYTSLIETPNLELSPSPPIVYIAIHPLAHSIFPPCPESEPVLVLCKHNTSILTRTCGHSCVWPISISNTTINATLLIRKTQSVRQCIPGDHIWTIIVAILNYGGPLGTIQTI